MAGLSVRGRDETLLALNARADVLSVAGEGVAFGGRSAALMGRGFFEAVQVADRPSVLAAVADAVEKRASVAVQLRIDLSQPEAPASFADASLTIHPSVGGPHALANGRLGQGRRHRGDDER